MFSQKHNLLGCGVVLLFGLLLFSSLFSEKPVVVAVGEQSEGIYLPLVVHEYPPLPTATPTPTMTPTPQATVTPEPAPDDPRAYVNYYRGLAGVAPVTFNATLDDNCFQHARYMAENNHLTHDQDPNLPYASPAGQICAEKGNAWLGGTSAVPYWTPLHPIDGWMRSVGHRLWLLYPTTPTFGYGFYTAANNRAGGALDILSEANFSADTSYAGWPVRYPAPNQSGIPASAYPITINWRYFGAIPTINTSSLTIVGGSAVAHSATTALPVSHKGIHIQPNDPLPDDTVFEVSVSGSYDGQPFSYTWRFGTGSAVVP
ncbi:MAG: CAP domain-containing protein [Chloroflexota bacterium]